MRDGVCAEAVFRAARNGFGVGRILEQTHVVNLMPPAQYAEHFESADLAAAGRGMQKMSINPENLHTGEARYLMYHSGEHGLR